MTGDDLRDWMDGRGYSVRRLASALGVNLSTVQRWRDGSSPVPPWLPLALRGIEAGEE